MNSGIYKIVNVKNGRFYIGSAIDLQDRKRRHFQDLAGSRHANKFLQRDYFKCGKEVFGFVVLTKVESESLLGEEQKYLDLFFDKQKLCYNILPTAGSWLGKKHTEETKRKMRATQKGRKGFPHAAESKQKISKANKGRKCPLYSAERRRNMSKIHGGKLNGMYGKKHTDAAKKAMSEKRSGENHYLFGKPCPSRQGIVATNLITKQALNFVSQLSAAKCLHVNQGSISNNLRGKEGPVKNWVFKTSQTREPRDYHYGRS